MKPNKVENCKYVETCESAKSSCIGCNVWNYLYNTKALHKWCRENGKDFMLFTMEMHKMLNRE